MNEETKWPDADGFVEGKQKETDVEPEADLPNETEVEAVEEKAEDAPAKDESVTEEEAKAIVEKNENHMMAQPGGYLIGNSLEEQYRLAKCYAMSKMVPKSYTTPEQILVAFQYARELGLQPLMAMKNIAVINGTPSLWGEMPLALVKKSGELKYFDEYFVDDNGEKIDFTKRGEPTIWAAICEIQRKGDKKKKVAWTAIDAQTAIKGLSDIWNRYPRIMWKRKCRAIALKDNFPDLLLGMGIVEYDREWKPDMAEIKPGPSPKGPDINKDILEL